MVTAICCLPADIDNLIYLQGLSNESLNNLIILLEIHNPRCCEKWWWMWVIFLNVLIFLKACIQCQLVRACMIKPSYENMRIISAPCWHMSCQSILLKKMRNFQTHLWFIYFKENNYYALTFYNPYLYPQKPNNKVFSLWY